MGVGGGGVMNWVIGIDMYTMMCIKLMIKKKKLRKCTFLPDKFFFQHYDSNILHRILHSVCLLNIY